MQKTILCCGLLLVLSACGQNDDMSSKENVVDDSLLETQERDFEAQREGSLQNLSVEIDCDDEQCYFEELKKVMQLKDELLVTELAQNVILPFLGEKAGVPQDVKKYSNPKNLVVEADLFVSEKEMERVYQKYWQGVKNKYELSGALRGTELPEGKVALFRDYTRDLDNLLYFVEAGVENKEEVLDLLEKEANYLLKMQTSEGLFATPDLRKIPEQSLKELEKRYGSPLMMVKEAQLSLLQDNPGLLEENAFERVDENSWQIYHANGGMQFDQGLMLHFLSRLYRLSSNEVAAWNYIAKRDTYLQAAREAAVWIERGIYSSNFNYNSFSTYGLAELYRVTGEERYLNLALERAKIGVIPGIIPEGYFDDWRDGRLMDAHNAKSVYHWIVVRAMVALSDVLPENHVDYALIEANTKLLFEAGIEEINEFGIFRLQPIYEIASYCSVFECDAKQEEVMNSLIYRMVEKNYKEAIGTYYFLRKVK